MADSQSTPAPVDSKPRLMCRECGGPFPLRRSRRAVFCSRECSHRSRQSGRHISPTDMGEMREIAVCADLLARGLHPFKAVSRGCLCDIVVLADGRPIKVEVTGAWYTAKGELGGFTHDAEQYDVMAYMTPDGRIHYRPDVFPPRLVAVPVSDA